MDQFWNSVSLETWRALASALLIGTLVGAQREGAHRDEPDGESREGMRDYLLVSAIAAVCGLLQIPVLTVCAFFGIVAFSVVFKRRQPISVGLTSDLAAVAVFCLSFMAVLPAFPQGAPIAIALTIVLTVILESKRSLHKFFRETITEIEFNDTIRFLALIFVVYPLLPQGEFGPYNFFNPRRVWFFIILVSSISYIGYFLEKFLGANLGLKLTGILGGLASTTASTSAFAQNYRQDPSMLKSLWQACTIANAVQFPRVLVLLWVISRPLATMALIPVLVMSAVGLCLAVFLRPGEQGKSFARGSMNLRNPLALRPAFHFGLILIAIVLLVKAAVSQFGSASLIWTSALAGLIDVDSIAISVGDLFNTGKTGAHMAVSAVLLALVANAIFKCWLAWIGGGRQFAWRVAASFVIMLGAGGLTLVFL
jgi:uncharacterized membrane protein (DUF4010 family)